MKTHCPNCKTDLTAFLAQSFGRIGGKATSEAKTRAARENAKRPRAKRKA